MKNTFSEFVATQHRDKAIALSKDAHEIKQIEVKKRILNYLPSSVFRSCSAILTMISSCSGVLWGLPKQWAAVRTHWLLIKLPPHITYLRSPPNFFWLTIPTCQGHSPYFAWVPPTTRLLALIPHTCSFITLLRTFFTTDFGICFFGFLGRALILLLAMPLTCL